MKISDLKEEDVGKWVIYAPNDFTREEGKIKSWNDKFIFVVYKCDNQWHRFEDFTGQATNPEDLTLRAGEMVSRKAHNL